MDQPSNPWKLEEQLLGLGLGPRETVAMVHEAMDPEMWITIRAAGFRESANLSTGMFLLEMQGARWSRRSDGCGA